MIQMIPLDDTKGAEVVPVCPERPRCEEQRSEMPQESWRQKV